MNRLSEIWPKSTQTLSTSYFLPAVAKITIARNIVTGFQPRKRRKTTTIRSIRKSRLKCWHFCFSNSRTTMKRKKTKLPSPIVATLGGSIFCAKTLFCVLDVVQKWVY